MANIERANIEWWKIQGAADLLVGMAADLDAQYPGRAVYGVGHSPSWLVYALGALRAQRGEDKRTGHIPHSGRLHDLARDDMFVSPAPALTIHYESSTLFDASPVALGSYFNFLSRHGVDPRTISARHGAAGAPVLVDYARKAEGLATFLRLFNDLADAQGVRGPAAGGFDTHIYKMWYDQDRAVLDIGPVPGGANTAPCRISCAVATGVAGDFMNMMAGQRGYDSSEKDASRFVPSYPLADGYNPASYARNYPAPVNGLRCAPSYPDMRRVLKESIAMAVTLRSADPAAHAARAQAAGEEIHNGSPTARMLPPRQTWTFMNRGYH